MYNTSSKEEFKEKFMHQSDILSKLKRYKFDSNKLWSRVVKKGLFSKYAKEESIKLIKK